MTAVAAWLSQGTITWTGQAGDRLALLPLSIPAALLCAAAGLLALLGVRRGRSARPLALLALVALPWLPLPLPPALLLWSGPLVALVWIAVAGAMAPAFVKGIGRPRRPVWTAGLAAFAIGLFAWWQVAPQVPGGDEPHYLVITQSLLRDADLKIENNHRARDYRAYYAGDLPPDFRVRGRDGEIYSIHAPGVSALVAPAFAIGGYPVAVLGLLLLSALGSALAWHLAWLLTGREDAAWFGWAAVTASVTWIFHAFTIYPDGPGAVLLLTGAWALLRLERETAGRVEGTRPWLWHGAALALLPWMHSRFAVFAGGVGALVLLRMARVPKGSAKALAFLAVPSVSLIGWLSYFIAIYGTPDPAAPYGGETGSFAFVPDGLAGLLFDQRFGLIFYAPVLLFAFVGIGVMLRRIEWRRHGLEWLFVAIPYLVVVTYIAMWWGGRSAPARFFVPLLPWMALPAAAAWTALTRPSSRLLAGGALALTLFISTVLIGVADGRFAFNVRETPAAWLEWLNPAVDLASALPIWWRDDERPLFVRIAIWGGAMLAAWALARRFDGWTSSSRGLAITLVWASAASVASSAAWGMDGASGRLTTPAQLEALRTVSTERRLLAWHLPSLRRLPRSDVASLLTLEPARSTASGGAGRNDRPLFVLPAMPAGEYRVRPVAGGTDGWIMLGIGRDQFAIRTEPLAAARDGLTVRFPVDVRALVVRGDEDARRVIRGLEVRPIDVVPAERRLTEAYARQAVRYGAATVFFLDEGSYAEPEAFWVRGAAHSEVVVQPDAASTAVRLLLRNGAVENTVVVESGAWRNEERLAPGEERRLQVPLDPARGAALLSLTTSAGFVPAEVDPRSGDRRYLGVWVAIPDPSSRSGMRD